MWENVAHDLVLSPIQASWHLGLAKVHPRERQRKASRRVARESLTNGSADETERARACYNNRLLLLARGRFLFSRGGTNKLKISDARNYPARDKSPCTKEEEDGWEGSKEGRKKDNWRNANAIAFSLSPSLYL